MSRWLKRSSSLGFAAQSDYVTEQTLGFTWALVGADVQPDLARELIQMELLEGVEGASSVPSVGSKHGGKVKFKFPLEGLAVGYNPTTHTIGDKVPPWFRLLAALLGSGAANASFDVAHLASCVGTGSDIDTIVTSSGINTVGAFWASGPSLRYGWIKSKTGTPETLTMALPMNAVPENGDSRYPSATIALTSQQPVPTTLRYIGNAAELGWAFIGAICEDAVYNLDAKQVPTVELTYSFTNHKRLAAAGGLQVPTACVRLPPLLGDANARVQMGGVIRRGLGSLKLQITNEIGYVEDHNSAQGVYEAFVSRRTVKISCNVPIDTADTLTDGNSPWETMLVNGTATSLCLSVGTAIGRIFSMFAPALRLMAQPKIVEVGGQLCESLEFEAAPYSDDSDPTAPGNTVLRFGLA